MSTIAVKIGKEATPPKTVSADEPYSELALAIKEGLDDVANGRYTEIRRSHIKEDVEKLFERIRKES